MVQGEMNQDDRELLRLLPKVLRARDFHLYIEGGKRLTDLWLAGGRAVLGHKPPGVLRELKNAAERGLFTPLPHPMERRFLKALGGVFPDRSFRLYPDAASLNLALEKAGFTPPAALWRPFSEMKPGTIFSPVLPWPLGPEVLVLDKGLDATFPPGEIISPVLLAAATRAFYDLTAEIRKPSCRFYPKIAKALAGQKSFWRCQGIYLTPEAEMGRDEYKSLFLRFLEGGYLIPPSPREPLILPAAMSAGEESKLAELLK